MDSQREQSETVFYVEWTPKWAGDKIKICSHQTGVHYEDLDSGSFCNDCGCLVGYTKVHESTSTYVFDRRKEKVILEFSKDEINKILSSLGRKWI